MCTILDFLPTHYSELDIQIEVTLFKKDYWLLLQEHNLIFLLSMPEKQNMKAWSALRKHFSI